MVLIGWVFAADNRDGWPGAGRGDRDGGDADLPRRSRERQSTVQRGGMGSYVLAAYEWTAAIAAL